MESVIRAPIVRIGNSRGIRIPKVWLEQLGLGDEVEMAVERNRLVIRRARDPREGWAEAFREIAARKEDVLMDGPIPTRWESEEWEW